VNLNGGEINQISLIKLISFGVRIFIIMNITYLLSFNRILNQVSNLTPVFNDII
jgi:hypothetical protein